MKNLIKWLERNGYSYETVRYGSGYFPNTSISYECVMVFLDREKYGACVKGSAKIEKYACRYGYKIISDGYNLGGAWLSIGTSEIVNQLKLYWKYQEKAVRECEIIMHNYHLNNIYTSHHAELEKELKRVMAYYESEYIKDSFHIVGAVA